tara:strand:- start:1945 stop:2625 length:681 start_codon:yes stop_codon:yes gene_type:complete
MDIFVQLQKCIDTLQGDFVVPKNAYENIFCKVIGWKCEDSRYYDAISPTNKLIEIKKGQTQMWFDLVRYAEIVQGIGEQNTYTVFMKWDKKCKLVEECYIIRTNDLIRYFGLSMDDWKSLQQIDKKLPRRLNAQASLYYKDMKELALYIVQSSWKKNKIHNERKRKRFNNVNNIKKRICLLKERLEDVNESACIAIEDGDVEKQQAEYYKANNILEQIEYEETLLS